MRCVLLNCKCAHETELIEYYINQSWNSWSMLLLLHARSLQFILNVSVLLAVVVIENKIQSANTLQMLDFTMFEYTEFKDVLFSYCWLYFSFIFFYFINRIISYFVSISVDVGCCWQDNNNNHKTMSTRRHVWCVDGVELAMVCAVFSSL